MPRPYPAGATALLISVCKIGANRAVAPSSLAREDDIPHQRIDLVGPTIAAEDAIMPDTGLHVVALEVRPEPRAQLVGCGGLSDGADVVALAFDGEQHRALDGARLDPLTAPRELAGRQRVLLKNAPHRLKIELGGQVEHGEIFVLERFRHLRLLVLAPCEQIVKLPVRFQMPP